MRSLPLLCLVAACDRTPPSTDDGFTATFGDDDDDDDDGSEVPCDPEEDGDGDGTNACDDCDDEDPLSFPGAAERCDLEDNDCDGEPHPDELAFDCVACEAAGFWQGTRGLEGEALIAALHTLTEGQECSDYSAATTFLFIELDKLNDEVECVYTGRKTPIVNNYRPDPTDMNTEHSWPQSLGAEAPPAECDLHHLYPTDSDTNNLRANHPFGEVVDVSTPVEGGSLFGTDAGGATAFEPRDAHKGNVARSMVYFAMRYGYPLTPAETSLYQAWSTLDPVDTREIDRTLLIADRQLIANPYVLCPWLVDAL